MGLLSRLIPRAATPENPRFSLNDPGAWEAFFAGAPSSANIPVNRQSALTLPSFYRAVNLVANGIAKIPLVIYERTPDGKKVFPAHDCYQKLLYQVNETETAFAWKRTMMQHALVRGNGYTYIDRFGNGKVKQFLHLDPDSTYPVRTRGRVWYVVKVNGEERKLAAEDVLHWAGPGWDGLCGYDVLTYGREALGEGMAKQRYSASFFGNNARPSAVIEVPTKMKNEAKKELLQGWDRMHKGLENAHKTAILDGGAKLALLSVSAEQAQLIESRRFSLIDIANIVGVPPHKVGAENTTSYGSLEQEDEAYLGDGLDPWMVMIEQDSRMKLLTEEEKEKDSALLEFDRKKLIRSSATDRSSYFRTALAGQPWMTADEVRTEEGLNPLGGDAATYQKPANMGKGGPGGQDNEPDNKNAPRPGNPKKQGAIARVLADACRRVVVRVGLHARRAAKDPKKYLAWVESFPAEHAKVVAEILGPATEAAGGTDVCAQADRLLQAIAGSLSMLADLNTAAKLPEAVEGCLGEMEANLPVAWALEILGET
jgi:HK97 family phage portal protein